MSPHPWAYFQSFEEAEDWLSFDASMWEREMASMESPDQFEEWSQWCAAGRMLDSTGSVQ